MPAEGTPWIGPRMAELLARETGSPQAAPAHQLLTPREAEIVALIGAGLQVKQVAAELGISISSVNTYRTRIFRKMGLSSNAALIRYACSTAWLFNVTLPLGNNVNGACH
jgi:two-component system invasion response regulator UvrY